MEKEVAKGTYWQDTSEQSDVRGRMDETEAGKWKEAASEIRRPMKGRSREGEKGLKIKSRKQYTQEK